jgi:antitoxin component HigA of HigAB toxin-antitoxin module
VNAISNPEDHAKALERLEELMVADPPFGSSEDIELGELALKIDTFEREHIKIPKPTAEEKHLVWIEQAQQIKHSSEPT